MKDFKPETQAKNAIKWINELTNYKQAEYEKRGKLGDEESGFCCLGAGCVITGVAYDPKDFKSTEFTDKVGLISNLGAFTYPETLIHGERALANLNDLTSIGFEGIAKVMRENPEEIFFPEVAKLIKEAFKCSN